MNGSDLSKPFQAELLYHVFAAVYSIAAFSTRKSIFKKLSDEDFDSFAASGPAGTSLPRKHKAPVGASTASPLC
jgi:hypothetical protein